MHRFLILLISFTVLFSSTCSMKNMLWEQLGIESAVPAKPFSSKGISFQNHTTSLLELCSANISSFDEAEIIPVGSTNAPLLLLSVLFVLFLTLPGLLEQKRHSYSYTNYSQSGAVPIYLKLGRLIYYS